MASASRRFIAALYRFGSESAQNKAQLQTWKSEALTAIAENKGGNVVSGSANGVSFALGGDSAMNNSDWFTALDTALIWVDQGVPPSSRTYVNITG